MARAPTMVIQEDYIDMDLTPTTTPLPPSSPRCGGAGAGLREFEFHSSAAAGKAFASPADELFYKGNLLPLHLPPRLQLVQKLLQEQQVQVQGIKKAGAPIAEVEDDIDMSKVCAKKYSWSKRLKLMKRWTSREYIKSLFLATTKPSDIVVGGNNGGGGGSVLDQEELCGHRKSFSGIIRRVRLVATKAASASASAPGTSPLCSTSSSSSSTPSCGNASGFFTRPAAAPAALKRSSSAGSEEGAIQGAIAHCKRSQHQHLQQQRRSVSDVVFYSVTNTPRVSSVAAGEAAQERQEMCRG
ncbi:hypothetical protein E2562_008369 [Oryza meyeriana var. granulata]|uniref:Uncharacterized protein n=1 Tax=Oryza meyeriana var. granulata TaxID=110450 RepID=A0A6G1EGU6_9ORYZ|nr:hypothetical protein E2562_008369 [Oryza meyeriana var. granulata]